MIESQLNRTNNILIQTDHSGVARSLAILSKYSFAVNLSSVRLILVTQYLLPFADILASQAKLPAFFHFMPTNRSSWICWMVGWDNYQFHY